MNSFRRAKLALDAFRNFASKVVPKAAPVRGFSSTIRQNGSPISGASKASFFGFSSISQKLGFSNGACRSNQKHYNPFLGGAKRFYYVDRNQVHHFEPRGSRRWFQNRRNVTVLVVLGSGVVITVYFGSYETVPYTKRNHFVLLTRDMERKIGEMQFDQMKKSFKRDILPAIHPESVRVRLIAKEIIEALQRGLQQDVVWSDLGYASESEGGPHDPGVQDTMMALKERGLHKEEGGWFRGEEVLDDKWVEESRKKGKSHSHASHLEGLDWEVIVVNEPIVNAFCLPGGKIVVYTGLLKHFKTDAEIATIIGHEVAHAVARHPAELVTNNLWVFIAQIILLQFFMADIVNTMSNILLRLPFSRRMEMEADYIGLLLLASAGYDPRVAPKVYQKLGDIGGGDSALQNYLSTHPSGKKRAELLSQAKVMQEALDIYREVKLGRAGEGFL